MKDSLLNAPFDENRYKEKLNAAAKAMLGFSGTNEALVECRAEPKIVVPKQFCKWPAFKTYFLLPGKSLSVPNGVIGYKNMAYITLYKDGSCIATDYQGRTSRSDAKYFIYDVTCLNDRFFIPPALCMSLRMHGKTILDKVEIESLICLPILSHKEWSALPETEWDQIPA